MPGRHRLTAVPDTAQPRSRRAAALHGERQAHRTGLLRCDCPGGWCSRPFQRRGRRLGSTRALDAEPRGLGAAPIDSDRLGSTRRGGHGPGLHRDVGTDTTRHWSPADGVTLHSTAPKHCVLAEQLQAAASGAPTCVFVNGCRSQYRGTLANCGILIAAVASTTIYCIRHIVFGDIP